MYQTAMNILHVEDDPADALIVQEMLMDEVGSNANYNLIHVDNLKDALRTLKGRGVSAVLLDLALRDISGLDNVKAIKEENPDIPIVVLTGFDNEEVALQAVRHGAQEYLVKGHGDGNVVRLAIKSSIERKAYERQLFQQAHYDDLTGLPNRRSFIEHLKLILTRAERWQRHEAVLFLDLNKFKDINDTLGHEIGNKLLRQVACRLKAGLRSCDLVARYGGDEFVVHLDGRSAITEAECEIAAQKIITLVNAPFDIKGHKISISVSIGISIYPKAGKDALTLLENADKAMYAAKHQGANKFVFVH